MPRFHALLQSLAARQVRAGAAGRPRLLLLQQSSCLISAPRPPPFPFRHRLAGWLPAPSLSSIQTTLLTTVHLQYPHNGCSFHHESTALVSNDSPCISLGERSEQSSVSQRIGCQRVSQPQVETRSKRWARLILYSLCICERQQRRARGVLGRAPSRAGTRTLHVAHDTEDMHTPLLQRAHRVMVWAKRLREEREVQPCTRCMLEVMRAQYYPFGRPRKNALERRLRVARGVPAQASSRARVRMAWCYGGSSHDRPSAEADARAAMPP